MRRKEGEKERERKRDLFAGYSSGKEKNKRSRLAGTLSTAERHRIECAYRVLLIDNWREGNLPLDSTAVFFANRQRRRETRLKRNYQLRKTGSGLVIERNMRQIVGDDTKGNLILETKVFLCRFLETEDCYDKNKEETNSTRRAPPAC